MELKNVGTKADYLLFLNNGKLNIRAVSEVAMEAQNDLAIDCKASGLFAAQTDDLTVCVWSELDETYPNLFVAVKEGLEADGFTVAVPERQKQYLVKPEKPEFISVVTSD